MLANFCVFIGFRVNYCFVSTTVLKKYAVSKSVSRLTAPYMSALETGDMAAGNHKRLNQHSTSVTSHLSRTAGQ